MKKERKEELIHSFPSVPCELREKMTKRGAHNYAVLLTYGKELYVRCFHHYSRGGKDALAERQRYVFAKDGAVRWGSDDGYHWTVRKEFRDPVFCKSNYGYNFDNKYTVLNFSEIHKSDMRYSQADKYTGDLLMSYLGLYVRHPNVEYLVKQGYEHLIYEEEYGYWYGTGTKLRTYHRINWKSNDLLKMLGLSRIEFKLLQGREKLYECYVDWREKYPYWKAEDLMSLALLAGDSHGLFETCCKISGTEPLKLVRYLVGKQSVESISDYKDYLDQCKKIGYDLKDRLVVMPHNFHAKHEELNEIERTLERERKEETHRILEKQMNEHKELRDRLEYRLGDLILIQPKSLQEIVDEGATLSHCVGGFAERHARGALTIMFLRRAKEPDKPYYTMEVSKEFRIVQCRGYANNVIHRGGEEKPQEIVEFEKTYQQYLNTLKKSEKARKSA